MSISTVKAEYKKIIEGAMEQVKCEFDSDGDLLSVNQICKENNKECREMFILYIVCGHSPVLEEAKEYCSLFTI